MTYQNAPGARIDLPDAEVTASGRGQTGMEYKIIGNTTGSDQALQSVIMAAYKSKWEPVKIKNNKVIYWVEKTYSFN